MTTPSSEATTINPDCLAVLHRQLEGGLSLPGDPEYAQARRLWNGMIDRRPAAIVHPRGVSDILRAVLFAREQQRPIAIKGGGHNVAGHAIGEDAIVLSMGAMRSVHVDPHRRTARVEAGATWADFDRETGLFGLATTGGAISSTGVTGLTLGGGVGWLAGKHGLAIDNLRSVDLITADGDLISASVDERPELFWALRGGGGNFGVVTSLEFQLHPLDQVLAGVIAYPIEQARSVLDLLRELTESAPDELTIYCSLMREPESETRVIALAICWSGDLAAGERALQPLLTFGAPLMRMIGPMPYPAWQSANDALFPHGRRYYWQGAMLPALTDRTLDAIAAFAVDPPLPWMNATIEFYGGAMNRVERTATAFPHRAARYQALSIGAWDDPADDATGIAWARALNGAISDGASGGAFLNFVSAGPDAPSDRARAGFGPHWDRLVAFKHRYDPTNLFRHNHNIQP